MPLLLQVETTKIIEQWKGGITTQYSGSDYSDTTTNGIIGSPCGTSSREALQKNNNNGSLTQILHDLSILSNESPPQNAIPPKGQTMGSTLLKHQRTGSPKEICNS
ncbi:hypothetical protein EMCRGX_G028641 [Ephydatia muelleri]